MTDDEKRRRTAAQDAWDRPLRHAPIPSTVSKAAQELFKQGLPLPEAVAETLAQHRAICDRIQTELGARQCSELPVNVVDSEIAGVPVRILEPRDADRLRRDCVLLNLHGGGFVKDSGSLTENIPIACLTGCRVVAVRYRLAPEHPFPAGRDDAVAVYLRLLESYPSERIGLYGTSAGAILSAQTLAELRRIGKPLPAVLGFFSGSADLSQPGESEYFFPLLDDARDLREIVEPYVGSRDLRSPALSPLYSDLRGFPPTLCICGTRDLMLSQTTIFHRALLGAGVDARLVVFEAMPHAHWSYLELPESIEAFSIMSGFLGSRFPHNAQSGRYVNSEIGERKCL